MLLHSPAPLADLGPAHLQECELLGRCICVRLGITRSFLGPLPTHFPWQARAKQEGMKYSALFYTAFPFQAFHNSSRALLLSLALVPMEREGVFLGHLSFYQTVAISLVSNPAWLVRCLELARSLGSGQSGAAARPTTRFALCPCGTCHLSTKPSVCLAQFRRDSSQGDSEPQEALPALPLPVPSEQGL